MKTNFFRKYTFGASLLLLPLLASCNPQTSGPKPPATNTPAVSDSAPAALASAAPVTETPGTPDPAPPAAPAPPPDASPVSIAPDNVTAANELPPNIYPTSPLAQVIRLTQAGVDQGIIMTFVTNSSGTFNLDSDKIIYLRDMGLPNEIVTAMMQRDQQLQQQMAAANQPPVQPAPDTNTEPVPPRTEEPPPPPTEVTVNYFYGTLAPYGSWINVDGYGRCWRPSVCVYNPGWQPYCDHGHWVYTDCGWYWFSDYSWGWAPFHYGRWFQHPHWGWCWTPDTVWGPSWVTWRHSSGYCGWAPLPPSAMYRPGIGFFYRGSAVSIGFNWGLSQNCFTFVPTQFFCDPHPHQHRVAPGQVTQIFNQTTVINNFNVRDHNFVNQGIDPEQITAVTRRPIRPVALQNSSAPAGHGPHGDQFSHDGSTLIVNRPGVVSNPAPDGNRYSHPAHPVWQSQVPVVTTHDPQEGNAVRIPPQHPTPPANYNSTPAPNPDNRTFSPRGWEQSRPPQSPRPNSYNPGPPASVPAPGQGQSSAPGASPHSAPATAPAEQHPQRNQSSSSPAASPPLPPRSSGQNQNQNGSGNNSGNNSGSAPKH